MASSGCGVWELGGGSEGTAGEGTGWRDVSLDSGGAGDRWRRGGGEALTAVVQAGRVKQGQKGARDRTVTWL